VMVMTSASAGAWRRAQTHKPAEDPRPPLALAPPGGTDDAELLQRVANGEEAALRELYKRHAQVVLAHALTVTGDQPLAEEVLQDTMLAIWQHASTFRGRSQPRSWIIAIARRRARDRLRKRRFSVANGNNIDNLVSPDAGPEARALRREDAGALTAAIASLNERHREVFEASQVLGVPVGTVKSRLAGAKVALGRAMRERGWQG